MASIPRDHPECLEFIFDSTKLYKIKITFLKMTFNQYIHVWLRHLTNMYMYGQGYEMTSDLSAEAMVP